MQALGHVSMNGICNTREKSLFARSEILNQSCVSHLAAHRAACGAWRGEMEMDQSKKKIDSKLEDAFEDGKLILDETEEVRRLHPTQIRIFKSHNQNLSGF
jgi:hypothetical protein